MIKKPKSERKPLALSKRKPLTDATIRRIVNKMPGGLKSFCAHWGWLTFARRIEQAHRIR